MNYGMNLLFLALIFSIIGKQTKIKNKILIIFTTIFFGFNYGMGGDWRSYKRLYEEIIPYISLKNLGDSGYEKGYVILNYIFNKLRISYEGYQIIVLLLCIFIILNLLEKKANNFYVAYVYVFNEILLIYSTEPVLRQLIALTIIIISLNYIEKGQVLTYLILVFLAFQFHESALIGVFFLIFKYYNINSIKKILFIFILMFIISHNIEYILKIVLEKSFLFKKYSVYLTNGEYLKHVKRSLLGNMYLLTSILIYFLIILFTKFQRKYLIYLNLAIVGIIFGIFQNHFPILSRFSSYFVVPIAIVISNINNLKIDLKLKKIFIFIFLFIQIFTKIHGILKTEIGKRKYYYYKNYLIESLKSKEREYKLK